MVRIYDANNFRPGDKVAITAPHTLKKGEFCCAFSPGAPYGNPLWVLDVGHDALGDNCYILGRVRGDWASEIRFSWYDDELTLYSNPDLTDSEIEESGENVDILIK